jgi:hypothetical protein
LESVCLPRLPARFRLTVNWSTITRWTSSEGNRTSTESPG